MSAIGRSKTRPFWVSKPYPSPFAVEALYFDVRDKRGNATTTDSILFDPIVSGVKVHTYYSSEGDPERTAYAWGNKLWTPTRDTWTLHNRQTFALDVPFSAKYIKVEFSQLQPRPWHSVIGYPLVVTYAKYPKWVLDQFLLNVLPDAENPNEFTPRLVSVAFNALDLAYNYYLDDLHPRPTHPVTLAEALPSLSSFLSQSDSLDKVDTQTLSRISNRLNIYQLPPLTARVPNSLLSKYLQTADLAAPASSLNFRNQGTFAVEQGRPDPKGTTVVSSNIRGSVLQELSMPDLFFFTPSRHRYRITTGRFFHHRAYFAGLKSIAFQRNHYSAPVDDESYTEIPGDNLNSELNDFVKTGDLYSVY